QPAAADPKSIRGNFWCDNGGCNLVHSSDDTAEAIRELEALKLSHWLDEPVSQLSLMGPRLDPIDYVPHSGIAIVCDIVKRALSAAHDPISAVRLPVSGNAVETNHVLTQHLEQVAAEFSAVAPLLNAFLHGDVIATSNLLNSMPVTDWERLVIQCGAINRGYWG
ncbi:MAG: hypothetical protein AAGD96_08940, partial [Chloroflexota bacterium]